MPRINKNTRSAVQLASMKRADRWRCARDL